MKMFKYTVEFQVAEEWIADGFDLTDERALNMLANDLGYADMSTELSAKVVKYPSAESVAKAQGYTSTKEVEKVRKEGLL